MVIPDKQPREKASEYARRVILNNIVNLELPPGALISENELSSQLSVSRTPIREALIEMEKIDLIEVMPQKGSYVTRIAADQIEDSKFIRLSLEKSVVRLACEEGVADDYLDRLHRSLEKQKGLVENPSAEERMIELDNHFHRLLFQAVGKERVFEFLQSQMVHFDRLRNLTFQKLQNTKYERTLKDHEHILYAVEERDVDLAETVIGLHFTRHQDEMEELSKICPDYFEGMNSRAGAAV